MTVYYVVASMVEAYPEKGMTTLEDLIARTRCIRMNEGQLREQRLSFVYGNIHIENERVTRDIVARADEKVTRERMIEATPRS